LDTNDSPGKLAHKLDHILAGEAEQYGRQVGMALFEGLRAKPS
jgi:hypothetical protein